MMLFTVSFLYVSILTSYILSDLNKGDANCYGSGRSVPGKVASEVPSQVIPLGNFHIHWNDLRRQLYVKHSMDTEKVLWSSIASSSFISAAPGVFESDGHDAMFRIRDLPVNRTDYQTIDRIEVDDLESSVSLSGDLKFSGQVTHTYRMTFSLPSENQLRFEVVVTPLLQVLNSTSNRERIYLKYSSEPDEKFFGFGEQFTHTESSGSCVPILVSENGVGRGLQPFTSIVNFFFKGAGGNPRTTYTGVPHYISSHLRSVFLENTEFVVFDLTRSKTPANSEVEIELVTSNNSERSMIGRIISGRSPSDLIKEYTSFSGRMKPLPDWISTGAVVGMQGGTDAVKKNLDVLLSNNVPVAALWLQDWTGKRQTAIGARLWWNWESDPQWYVGWQEFVDDLAGKNIRVMTYINPFLAIMDEKLTSNSTMVHHYFAEAKDAGCLVKDKDHKVVVEKSATPEFLFGIVDLSTQRCKTWYKSVIHENMLLSPIDKTTLKPVKRRWGEIKRNFPVSGWMADFGEYIPLNGAKLNSGVDSLAAHNSFPVWWAATCQEAVAEAGLEEDVVFFTRSGSARTPAHSTLHWHGDQLPSWDEFDGLKSVLRATLSAGLSGYSLVHSDIGGYTTVSVIPYAIDYVRDEELLLRWAELSAVADSIFRTHEGLRPKKMIQVYQNSKVAAAFGRYANIHGAFSSYRKKLMHGDMTSQGLPLARHMIIHYIEDEVTHALQDQFMLGSEFIMAPVMNPKTNSVKVYLPGGNQWIHLLTGKEYSPGHYILKAPLGTPAILYKKDSPDALPVLEELVKRGII